MSRATGMAVTTIGRGLRELADGAVLEGGWVRQPGGGRKALAASDPGLLDALLALVHPSERGDPMSPLRWTCKSLRRLAAELVAQGHQVSHTVVGALLRAEGFSLQANQKTLEGSSHPDRDAQFAHIAQGVSAALAAGQPVISVDTKKKGKRKPTSTFRRGMELTRLAISGCGVVGGVGERGLIRGA